MIEIVPDKKLLCPNCGSNLVPHGECLECCYSSAKHGQFDNVLKTSMQFRKIFKEYNKLGNASFDLWLWLIADIALCFAKLNYDWMHHFVILPTIGAIAIIPLIVSIIIVSIIKNKKHDQLYKIAAKAGTKTLK